MNDRFIAFMIGLVAIGSSLAGCGGGSSGITPVGGSSVSSSNLNSESTDYALNIGKTQLRFPAASTTTGLLALDLKSVSTNAKAQVSTTHSSLEGLRGKSTAEVGSTAIIYTTTLSISGEIGLNAPPVFKVSSAQFANVPLANLSYKLFDDAALTHVIAESNKASDLTGNTAGFYIGDSPPLVLDAQHVYTFVFYQFTPGTPPDGPAPANQLAALFALPQENAVLAIDVSKASDTPSYRLIDGPQTELNGPFSVASGAHGEIVVMNQVPGNTYDLNVPAYGKSPIFDRNASGNEAPISTYANNGNASQLRGNSEGIVYANSGGSRYRGAITQLVYGTNPMYPNSNSNPITDRSSYGVSSMAIAKDGQLAAPFFFAGTPGGVFTRSSGVILGNQIAFSYVYSGQGDYNGGPPAVPQLDLHLAILELQFSPVDNNLYVLSGTQADSRCIGPVDLELKVYAQSEFALETPVRTVKIPESLVRITTMQFDKIGRLFIYGVTRSGDRMVNVYSDPSVGSQMLNLVYSVNVESVLRRYNAIGFAIQVQ